MAEYFTAKFDTLSQAEAAATKMRAIRANDVEISHWNRPLGNTDVEFAMEDINYTGYVPYGGSGGFPSSVGGFSTGGTMLPYIANDDYSYRGSDSGYLLNARVDNGQREQAIRIIKECGGGEI